MQGGHHARRDAELWGEDNRMRLRSRIVQLTSPETLAETPFCALGHFGPRWTISHGAVIAAGKATSHRRFVKLSGVFERPAGRGSGQQIPSRIASPTDVAAYPIRSMIRHQTRDNALMSSSSSAKRIKSEWRRCSAVVAMPHRLSLAIPSDIAGAPG